MWIIFQNIINICVNLQFILQLFFILSIALLTIIILSKWSIINIDFVNILIALKRLCTWIKIHICICLSLIFYPILKMWIFFFTCTLLYIIYWQNIFHIIHIIQVFVFFVLYCLFVLSWVWIQVFWVNKLLIIVRIWLKVWIFLVWSLQSKCINILILYSKRATMIWAFIPTRSKS